MKLRGVLIVAVIAVVFVGSVVYGARQFANRPAAPAQPAASPGSNEDAFLKEVREKAKQIPPTENAKGLIPPVNGDQSLVPSISVEPAALDLGVVSREGMATGEIKVLNKGKGVLQIAQVSTSCGCTKATIAEDKKTVPPDGESVIAVSVDPKRIPGFESTKTVTITSNDPQQQRLNIQVTAKIDPEFELEPKELNFGEVEKGTPMEKTMVFRQLQPDPIEILEAAPMQKAADMDISFVKRPENEWASPQHPEYLLTVRIPDDVSPGPFDGRFTIKTTCKRLPSYTCMVRANIKAFYDVTPGRQLIVRSNTPSGQAGAATATITADQPFEVTDLKASGEDLTVASKPGDKPNTAVIDVALKPDAQPGSRYETITYSIKAGDKVYKERLAARVYAGARPGSVAAPMAMPGQPAVPGQAKANSPARQGEIQDAFRRLRERHPPLVNGVHVPATAVNPDGSPATPVPPVPPQASKPTPPVPPQAPVAPRPEAAPAAK